MRLKLNLSLHGFAAIQFGAVTLLLLLGTAAYLFKHFTGHDSVLGFFRLLDVGHERSIPTLFSYFNLLLSSVLLLVIYAAAKKEGERASGYWLFLALLFVALSVDEAAGIHENFGRVQQYFADRGMLPAMENHRWVPFGIVFTFVVTLVLIPFLRRLPKDTALLLLAAGAVFVTGALGFEMLGTWMLSTGYVESRDELIYMLRRIGEEGLEMYGIAIFNIALYREILGRHVSIAINAIE